MCGYFFNGWFWLMIVCENFSDIFVNNGIFLWQGLHALKFGWIRVLWQALGDFFGDIFFVGKKLINSNFWNIFRIFYNFLRNFSEFFRNFSEFFRNLSGFFRFLFSEFFSFFCRFFSEYLEIFWIFWNLDFSEIFRVV